MTAEQRETAHDVSAATVHQALVARDPTMRDMDRERSASDDHAGHYGSLFSRYESAGGQRMSQWTDYMVQWLPRHLESLVAAAGNVPDPEHDASWTGDDEETAQLPPDPRQGKLRV